MRRVLVIGSGGAGKSTFSTRLGERTGLPVVHLDSLYWRAGWNETPKEEWKQVVSGLLERDAWVMDGNYGGTLDARITSCDTVVFLDLPRIVCLWRVLRRWLRYRGRARPDMAPGCNERLSVEFLRWIWDYPVTRRPEIMTRLANLGEGQRVVVLRSRAEVERFLEACAAAADVQEDRTP